MELDLYKTLWGHTQVVELACNQALEFGFSGLEGGATGISWNAQQLKKALSISGLSYIAEITTAGSYVPDRTATLNQHIESFKIKLDQSLELDPVFITCLGGCDAWENSKSVDFFSQAIDIAKEHNIEVSFETHRGRSLFNPFDARRICELVPELQLTCDFSHWCVVCERLLDSDQEDLEFFFKRARHIHARVGFDQGAQVSNPASALYQTELQQHLSWWQSIWRSQIERGFAKCTMTPEFGPDGYQMRDDESGKVIGNIWQNNCYMAKILKQQFHQSKKNLECLHA